MPKHVVILGCGRSGTSIFGELFDAIPAYQYSSEPAFEAVLGYSFERPVALKVPKESASHPAHAGLSFPIDTLLKAMPEPPIFFWQVRHPLDAVASLRVGISNNWGHHPRPNDWEAWRERPLIEQCAHHWTAINEQGYQAVKDFSTVSRFEDMLAKPHEFAIWICHTVGVDPDQCSEELKTWADRVQDSNNEKFVEAVTSRRYSRPDHAVRVGRWRENLNQDEVDTIWPMVADTASNFNYGIT